MFFYEQYHFGSHSYFQVNCSEDLNYPFHLHRSFELISVVSGYIEAVCSGQTYTLTKNQALLVFPNQIHSYQTGNTSRAIVSIFSPDLLPTFVRRMEGHVLARPVITFNDYLSQTLLRLQERQTDLITCKGALYTICAEFFHSSKAIESRPVDDLLLSKVLTYVQEHYTENIHLKDIARLLGYDYYYLSKYLKKYLGVPFCRFVSQHRISYAQYLLKQSEYSITEIAGLSGFSSLRTFNRVFLDETNLTPRQFRKLFPV